MLSLRRKVCLYIGKKTVYIGFGTTCGFRHPLGVLVGIPYGAGGATVFFQTDLVI